MLCDWPPADDPEEKVLFFTILSHGRTLIMPKRKKLKDILSIPDDFTSKNQTLALRK